MKTGIRLDEIVGAIAGCEHAIELSPEIAEHVGVCPECRERGRLRLEQPPHLEELEHGAAPEQARGRECRLEQLACVEAAHIGAVALPDHEHAGEREGPHRLAKRVSGQPELSRKVDLARESRARSPLAGDDQFSDLLDRILCQAGGATPVFRNSFFTHPSLASISPSLKIDRINPADLVPYRQDFGLSTPFNT